MGAIFFYIFIYFIGYYGSNVLNMLTVRPLVTNRFIAALLPVYGVALTHAYVMVSSPPPQGADITVEYALLVYITLPVVVVTLGAIYFMWNSRGNQEDHATINPAAYDSKSVETNAIEHHNTEIEKSSDPIDPADEKLIDKGTPSQGKDNKDI